MRRALIVVAVLISAADMQSATAQESFYDKRYCTQGGGRGGLMDCSFNTWEQCIEAARGLGRYCTDNPNWKWGQKKRAQQQH